MFRIYVVQETDCCFGEAQFSEYMVCPFLERMMSMHYATLVTVEIAPCTEDEVRKSLAKFLIREIETQKKKNPQHEIMLDIYESEVKEHSTAFSHEVAYAVDAVMEPYYCDTDNPEYLVFENKTYEYIEEYQTGSVNLVQFPNGALIPEKRYEVYSKYEIVGDRLYEKNWGPLHHKKRTKRCKKMQVIKNVPWHKFYKTFPEYVEAEEWGSYYEEQRAYGYYYNPDAFYDWYSIGGRWPDMFLVKEECQEYGIADRSWACGDEETKVPEGYRWTCAARKKDIEWQVMYEWKVKQAKERYAKLVQAFESGTLPEGIWGNITEDGITGFGEMLYQKGETEEMYLKRLANLKLKKYPACLYAFLQGGVWSTKEDFIWNGAESRLEENATWQEELEQFIDELDDDTVLVCVDCHM